jgi:hypothetical protein
MVNVSWDSMNVQRRHADTFAFAPLRTHAAR